MKLADRYVLPHKLSIFTAVYRKRLVIVVGGMIVSGFLWLQAVPLPVPDATHVLAGTSLATLPDPPIPPNSFYLLTGEYAFMITTWFYLLFDGTGMMLKKLGKIPNDRPSSGK